jgi:hypothetical protein
MRSALTLVGVCLAIVGLGACGSSSHSSTTSAGAGGAATGLTDAQVKARLTLAKCLRAHGINVPDSAATTAAPPAAELRRLEAQYSTAQIQAGLSDCRSALVAALPQTSLTPAEIAQRNKQALAYVRCLRAHGIANVPDPVPNGIRVGIVKALSDVDTNSPAFQAASKACASVLPARLLG